MRDCIFCGSATHKSGEVCPARLTAYQNSPPVEGAPAPTPRCTFVYEGIGAQCGGDKWSHDEGILDHAWQPPAPPVESVEGRALDARGIFGEVDDPENYLSRIRGEEPDPVEEAQRLCECGDHRDQHFDEVLACTECDPCVRFRPATEEAQRPCKACGGSGDDRNDTTCLRCHGSGYEPRLPVEVEDEGARPLDELWDKYDGIAFGGFLDDVLAQREVIEAVIRKEATAALTAESQRAYARILELETAVASAETQFDEYERGLAAERTRAEAAEGALREALQDLVDGWVDSAKTVLRRALATRPHWARGCYSRLRHAHPY